MSKEVAKQFIQKMNSDPELIKRVAGVGQSFVGLQEIASGMGYSFEIEDWVEAAREYAPSAGQELTEVELENVSGGTGAVTSRSVFCCDDTQTLSCPLPPPGKPGSFNIRAR